jgi:hypothetical protein
MMDDFETSPEWKLPPLMEEALGCLASLGLLVFILAIIGVMCGFSVWVALKFLNLLS